MSVNKIVSRGVGVLLTFSGCDGIFKSNESTKKELTTILVDDTTKLFRLYEEGNKAFKEQNYTEATKKFTAIESSISPEETNFQKIQILSQALNMLGNIKNNLRHSQEAIDYFNQIYTIQKAHNPLLGGISSTVIDKSIYLNGIETAVWTQLNSVAGYIKLQDIDAANQALNKAKELIKVYESHAYSLEAKQTVHELWAYYNNNLADFSLKQGSLDLADISFRDAFKKCELIQDHEGKLLAEFYLFYIHYLVFKKDISPEKRKWYFDNMQFIVFSLKQHYDGDWPLYTRELLVCFDKLLQGFDDADLWYRVSETKQIIGELREEELAKTGREFLTLKDEKFAAKARESEAKHRELEAKQKELEIMKRNEYLTQVIYLLSTLLILLTGSIGGNIVYRNMKKNAEKLKADNRKLEEVKGLLESDNKKLNWKTQNLMSFNDLLSRYVSHAFFHCIGQFEGILSLYVNYLKEEENPLTLHEILDKCWNILKDQNPRVRELRKLETIGHRITLFKKEQFDNIGFLMKRSASKIGSSYIVKNSDMFEKTDYNDTFYGNLDLIDKILTKAVCYFVELLKENGAIKENVNSSVNSSCDIENNNLLINFEISNFCEDQEKISLLCKEFESNLLLSHLMDKQVGNYDHIFQGKIFTGVLCIILYGSSVDTLIENDKIILKFTFPNLKESAS